MRRILKLYPGSVGENKHDQLSFLARVVDKNEKFLHKWWMRLSDFCMGGRWQTKAPVPHICKPK